MVATVNEVKKLEVELDRAGQNLSQVQQKYNEQEEAVSVSGGGGGGLWLSDDHRNAPWSVFHLIETLRSSNVLQLLRLRLKKVREQLAIAREADRRRTS